MSQLTTIHPQRPAYLSSSTSVKGFCTMSTYPEISKSDTVKELNPVPSSSTLSSTSIINDDNANSNDSNHGTISRDELTDLVRAIKFAHPDASQREVYREITEEIPRKFPQFAFLKGSSDDHNNNIDNNNESNNNNKTPVVQLNDVKKVWKKALQQQQQQQSPKHSTVISDHTQNDDLVQRLREMKIPPQLYTIGDTSKSLLLSGQPTSTSIAHEYMTAVWSHHQQQQAEDDAQELSSVIQDYVHVYLNIPANRSGAFPHQALINFQQQQQSSSKAKEATTRDDIPTPAKSINNKNKNKHYTNKKKTGKGFMARAEEAKSTSGSMSNHPHHYNETTTTTTAHIPAPFDNAIIVKIQMAAPVKDDDNESDSIQHPLLLYDQSRNIRTFVHPTQKNDQDNKNIAHSYRSSSSSSSNDDINKTTPKGNEKDTTAPKDDGYMKIVRWIASAGVSGAIGQTGGTKAYFYSRLTKVDKKKTGMEDILSIYVKELAPIQEW
jgi:hypothetical protein